jgi:hypothetical protein
MSKRLTVPALVQDYGLKEMAPYPDCGPFEPYYVIHHGTTSSIEAFSHVDGKRYVIAQTYSANGIKANVVADLVVQTLSKGRQNKELINEMLHALELCLESGGLTWESLYQATKPHMIACLIHCMVRI